jgi:tetratricopeptide (TPR) repeat protein
VKNWRVIIGRAALLASGPLLFFAGLEVFLFLTRKFEPVEVLKQVEYEGINYWVMEPEYTRRVLRRDNVIVRQRFFLPVERETGIKRVVLLGESAAAGYPLSEYGLGRMMKVLWEAEFPREKLEVVDMTSVGVNSHVLRVFAQEAMRTSPDAVVIYAGHNEMIGPFGAANVFGWQAPGTWFAQAGLALGNTRTGRALGLLADKIRGEKPKAWRGLDEFRAARLNLKDPAVARTAALAKDNFRAMIDIALRGGAKVLVCVPAVNLTDWPPLVSADGNEETCARAAYTKAQELKRAQRNEEAWKFFRRACDLDLMRFRADSRVRDAQREVVTEVASSDVLLVDADLRLHEENPGPLTDQDLFLEHVHLTFEGRVAVAALLVDGLAEILGVTSERIRDPQDWWEKFPARLAEARDRTMFTELEEGLIWQIVASLLQMEVFSSGPDMTQRRSDATNRVIALQLVAEKWRNPQLVLQTYTRAAEKNPDDPDLHDRAFRHFARAGDRQRAKAALQRAVALRPNHVLANLALAEIALEEGRIEDASRITKAAKAFQTGGSELDVIAAAVLAKRGNHAEALTLLERYTRRWPEDVRAISMLSSLHDYLGNDPEADKFYRAALAQQPDAPVVLNNFAWFLATKPNATNTERLEALFLAKRAVELQPRTHRYRGTLAVALIANERYERAREEGHRAIDMARKAGDSEAVRDIQSRLGALLSSP